MIPEMTHKLGRYWDQPDRSEIEVDDSHAMMSQETLDKLSDYSLSIPTGAYEGKMWKSHKAVRRNGDGWSHGDGWLLRWFAPSTVDLEKVRVVTREILIV